MVNILVIGCDNREDLLLPFKNLVTKSNLYFIKYNREKGNNYTKYGVVINWEEYKDAYSLLRKNNIIRVVFYSYEELKHIALRVAAKELGIKCSHLDHGIRIYKEHLKLSTHKRKYIFFLILPKFLLSRFYFCTFIKAKKESKIFLWKYNIIRQTKDIIQIGSFFPDSEYFILDQYICYSPFVRDGLIKELKVDPAKIQTKFIGFPKFNVLNNLQYSTQSRNILFIDQPFHEHKLFGWTKHEKEKFWIDLRKKLSDKKFNLIVKPHPVSDKSVYKKLDIEIDNNIGKDFFAVMGFYSTLLLPLVAEANIPVICFNNHPEKLEEIQNHFLVKAKMAIGIDKIDDIDLSYSTIESFLRTKQQNLNAFIEYFLYKKDELFSKRLVDILIADE